MNKEIMMPTVISIKDKKQNVKGQVVRAAIFARSKVIEVLTEVSEKFYLIFYKNSLIYGAKLDQLEEGTFINKALHEGIVIESPNPILTALIPHQSVSVPNKHKLFSHLQLHYSLQEMAYIATTLDSFFKKDQLIEIMDKIFYHFRRNGKFMKAFQVIQILHDFAPSFKSAKERLDSHEFHSYRDVYHSLNFQEIAKKDPLFVELYCFKQRSQSKERRVLENILFVQDSLSAVLLWLEHEERPLDKQTIEKYTEMALQAITMEEWIFMLGEVNINPFRVLPDTKVILEKMIQKGNYEQAAACVLHFIHDLPSSYDPILEIIWSKCETNFALSNLDKFMPLLENLAQKGNEQHVEAKISELAITLLNKHDLPFVYNKLLSIKKVSPQSEVIRKLNIMLELAEDPDRMMELGELYAEFKQFDQAIECFFWEMELDPQNPAPVQKISKMYQHKGLPKEAAAYQKIYQQLKTNQKTG